MSRPEENVDVDVEEPPPIFGTWRRFYAVVVGFLAFLIVAFYLFGGAFS